MNLEMKKVVMQPVHDGEAIVTIQFVGTPRGYSGDLVIDNRNVLWFPKGSRSSGRLLPVKDVIDELNTEGDAARR